MTYDVPIAILIYYSIIHILFALLRRSITNIFQALIYCVVCCPASCLGWWHFLCFSVIVVLDLLTLILVQVNCYTYIKNHIITYYEQDIGSEKKWVRIRIYTQRWQGQHCPGTGVIGHLNQWEYWVEPKNQSSSRHTHFKPITDDPRLSVDKADV